MKPTTTKKDPKSYLTPEIKEKYHNDLLRFNAVRTSFSSTSKLKKGPRKLLHVLETRSEVNNGDTKIRDSVLAEILSVSKSTITRYMKILVDFGYIARLTIKYKSSRDSLCYADRVIRCRRILLRNRMSVKENPNWTRDYRLPFKKSQAYDESTGTVCHPKWKMNLPVPINTPVYGVIQEAWSTFVDLFRMDLMDADQTEMSRKLNENRTSDMARLVLGTKCFSKEFV